MKTMCSQVLVPPAACAPKVNDPGDVAAVKATMEGFTKAINQAVGRRREPAMRRLVLFVILLALAVPALALAQAAPRQGGKVLLVIRDTSAPDPMAGDVPVVGEAGVMKDTLQRAGYQVDIASPTGEPWGAPGHMLNVDRKLKDIKAADYQAIVIPCLAIDSTALHPDLDAVIKAAVRQGRIIAAQNVGVAMLDEAGALAGKTFAISDEAAKSIKTGTRSGTGVVKDGRIITSGICPTMAKLRGGAVDGTPELMETLLAELKQAR